MSDWFSFNKLGRYAPTLHWMVIGAGDIGKTYALKLLALTAWMGERKKTVWLHNYETDMDENAGLFYSNFEAAQVPENITARNDGIYEDGERFIIFKSVNRPFKVRGPDYSDVKYIMFDEFCPRDGNYPKGASLAVLDILETVGRGRPDCKLIMCSNNNTIANPYMVHWQLMPGNQDVTVIEEAGFAIEIPRGYRKSKDSYGNTPSSKLMQRANYKRSLDREDFSELSLVAPVPQGARQYTQGLMVNGNMYGCFLKDGLMYWRRVSVDPGLLYCFDKTQVAANVRLADTQTKATFKRMRETSSWRFADAETLFEILGDVL